CIKNVMSHHFLEHIGYEKSVEVIKKIYRKMKPGAILRIAVPDKYDKINERSLMAHGHLFAWSYQSAQQLAKDTRMKIRLIHHYDECGKLQEYRECVREWHIDKEQQALVTENEIFQIIQGTGRLNTYDGMETREHSLFFELEKPDGKITS